MTPQKFPIKTQNFMLILNLFKCAKKMSIKGKKRKKGKKCKSEKLKTCIVFAFNFFHENFVEPISMNVESAYAPFNFYEENKNWQHINTF